MIYKSCIYLFLIVLFTSCGGGSGSSSDVDKFIQKSDQKISGRWNPNFAHIGFLKDKNDNFIGQAKWSEEKLKDDGSVDTQAEGNMTFIFNSFANVYLYIEILEPISIGKYDINEDFTELRIDSLKTVYKSIEYISNLCIKVSKTVDNKFDANYKFCKKFDEKSE